MGDTILLRRGTLANLPALQAGEPGWAEDANQLFIGTSTGSADSAMPIGHYDYCPEAFTQASIETTLTLIGTTNKRTIVLRPGTWPITAAADYSSYTNVTWDIRPGAVLQIATGCTMTIYGPVVDGTHQMFSHVGTGIVRFGPDSLLRFRPQMWGAIVDGTTNDGAAINAMFASARGSVALGAAAWVELPSGTMKTTIPINGGGFGNNYLKIIGYGMYQYGSTINGVMVGGVVLDLTANEHATYDHFNVHGDATSIPDIGVLISAANIGLVRGGNCYTNWMGAGGSFNTAAVYVYGADSCTIGQGYIGSGGTGKALIVCGFDATPTYAVASSFYTLDSTQGVTTITMHDNQFSAAGTAGKSVVFMESVTGIIKSTNDRWQSGINCRPLEIINSGCQLNVIGARDEHQGTTIGFLKTDGVKNGILNGTVYNAGALIPLIDCRASYGTGGGYLANMIIQLAPSSTGGVVMNSNQDCGILGCDIFLLDNQSIAINGSLNSSGNTIHNNGTGTITLRNTNTDDDGNIVIGKLGFQMIGGTGGAGALLKNHLKGTTSPANPGIVNAGVTTNISVTVTGAAVGNPAFASLSTLDEAGWQISAVVTSANTTNVCLTNTTAGNIAVPDGGVLTVTVFKY